MKKLFLDTEFTSLTKQGELISIALVAQDGSYFYAELNDYNAETLSQWHKDNVIASLKFNDIENFNKVELSTSRQNYNGKGTKPDVAGSLKKWLEIIAPRPDTKFQIWADVGHYDKVHFDDLFGGAFGIPGQVHYIFHELATLFLTAGFDPDINRVDFCKNEGVFTLPESSHNALFDAITTQFCYNNLRQKLRQKDILI